MRSQLNTNCRSTIVDASLTDQTRTEWRALGFYYDREDSTKQWRFSGSRMGLLRFADLLYAYVADPRNKLLSEHEHYGPYSYLEVMTWQDAGIDNHSIHGSLEDLERLGTITRMTVEQLRPGDTAQIREQFAADSEYCLVLSMREDDFDPASLDVNLVGGTG
jgi:hypothetical protein